MGCGKEGVLIRRGLGACREEGVGHGGKVQ